MNLAKLRAKFRQKVFGNPNNTDATNEIIDEYLNEGYQIYLMIALSAQGKWQINGNFATVDIVANKRDIAFDRTFLKLNEVYIKSRPNGKYIKASQRDVSDINADPLTDYTPLMPEFDLLDNNLFLYLPEGIIVDVPNGVRIHFEEEFTSLVETSDEPNIPKAFQPFLYKYGAREYCQDNKMWDKYKSLGTELKEMKDDIIEHYSNRSNAKPPIIEFAQENLY